MAGCGNASLCDSWNSFTYGNSTFWPDFEADADVAGLGVCVAFVASSSAALCFALAWIVLTASKRKGDNIIDDAVYAILRYPGWPVNPGIHREFWLPIIEKVILSLSDQVLLTGLAMLIALFSLHCSISVYHASIVADLVWFASNVHLTTLTVLSDFLLAHPTLRNWRVVLMIFAAISLAVTIVWQGHWAWFESEPFNAQCLWNDLGPKLENLGGTPKHWMIVNLGLLAFGYSTSLIYLYKPVLSYVWDYLYHKPLHFLDSIIAKLKRKRTSNTTKASIRKAIEHNFHMCFEIIVAICRLYLISIGALLSSYSVGFTVDVFWYSFGLWGIIIDRQIPYQEGTLSGDENSMGFGQIIPILLLASTIFVMREAYEGDDFIAARNISLSESNANSELDQKDATRHKVSGKASNRRTSEDVFMIAEPSQTDQGSAELDNNVEIVPLSFLRKDTNAIEMGLSSQASRSRDRDAVLDAQRRSTFPLSPGLTG